MQSFRTLAAAALGGLAGVAFGLAPAAAAPDLNSYKGRTVNYIIATAPGGGYDGFGRLTARYMEKHLPGSTFVVVNRPGAGHIIGTNLLYASKPDGLTIGSFNTGVIYSQLLKAKAARYDLAKMSWIGKATSDKRTILVAANTPYKTFLDFQKAKEPIPMAMSGVGSSSFIELKMLAKVFDLNFKFLYGYSGNDDEMAMLRGEVAGKMGTLSGQGAFVRDGRGRFVLQIGGARETGYGDMAYGDDLAKTPQQKAVITLIASQAEMYRVTAGPPNIRADRLEVLRAAYGKAYADPALIADAGKLRWELSPLVGEPVGKAIAAALEQPPEIIALITEIQNEKPGEIKVSGTLAGVLNEGREIAIKDAAGTEVKAKLSGSRSKIQVAGKDAKRGALKPGMSCTVTYTGPGTEASLVACQ